MLTIDPIPGSLDCSGSSRVELLDLTVDPGHREKRVGDPPERAGPLGLPHGQVATTRSSLARVLERAMSATSSASTHGIGIGR